jgi:hypothetical protein
MIYITDGTINKYIDIFEDQNVYKSKLEQLFTDQKDLMAFIDKDNQSLLSSEESGMLEYLTMILYYSASEQCGKISTLKGQDLEEAEEKNWGVFNSILSGSFSKALDTFFENYQQEDMLALVEDSLQPDEDQVISTVGREIILVACKSIIDIIHQNNN